MSIAQWLKTGKINTSTPTTIGMPDPNETQNNQEAMNLECANSAVETLIDDSPANSPCSTQEKENAETTTISMMGNERKLQNWPFKTAWLKRHKKTPKDLCRNVVESTVRGIRDQYNRMRRACVCMIMIFISKSLKIK